MLFLFIGGLLNCRECGGFLPDVLRSPVVLGEPPHHGTHLTLSGKLYEVLLLALQPGNTSA